MNLSTKTLVFLTFQVETLLFKFPKHFFCYLGCNLKSINRKSAEQADENGLESCLQNSKESNMATNLETKKLDLPEHKLVPREQVLVLILTI